MELIRLDRNCNGMALSTYAWERKGGDLRFVELQGKGKGRIAKESTRDGLHRNGNDERHDETNML